MWGLPILSFRFRGRVKRLLAIYGCFVEHPQQGLHPSQISRLSGLNFIDVNTCLNRTPELFVKLPRRDGVTRYRLTSAMAAQAPEEVEAFVERQARVESLTFYAIVAIFASAILVAVVMAFPFIRYL